ncbi:hypothetical protein AAV32_07350 [Kerstersia gyiorum]|uniref:Uncharacterized protein n=1 Tax=Kerstersia gyiorum TaxID=206506 RepID=A0A171KTC4_9BURK|nr:hypothetical protein AAV32_07350 [Kerstersia gyiorum]
MQFEGDNSNTFDGCHAFLKKHLPFRRSAAWQLATGNWQLATGNWQLATARMMTDWPDVRSQRRDFSDSTVP